MPRRLKRWGRFKALIWFAPGRVRVKPIKQSNEAALHPAAKVKSPFVERRLDVFQATETLTAPPGCRGAVLTPSGALKEAQSRGWA